jgi:hypothetical protein
VLACAVVARTTGVYCPAIFDRIGNE